MPKHSNSKDFGGGGTSFKLLQRVSGFTTSINRFGKGLRPFITMKGESGKGFTLAEVLITLGIIGVVAAMTLPSLVGKYKKVQTVTHLQKVYTTLNQALKLAEAEYGPYEYWEDGTDSENIYNTDVTKYYEKYWYPHFKILKVCNTYSECGYSSNKPWYYINGNSSSLTFTDLVRRVPFIIADGTLISISVAGGDELVYQNSIYVDLNGSKGPNMFGIDFFIFTRIAKKGILPYGYDQTTDKVNSNCKSGSGEYCAAKIINDGWKIKDDYNWK